MDSKGISFRFSIVFLLHLSVLAGCSTAQPISGESNVGPYQLVESLEFDTQSELIAFHGQHVFVYRPKESTMLVIDYISRSHVAEVHLEAFRPALSIAAHGNVYFFEQPPLSSRSSLSRESRIGRYTISSNSFDYARTSEAFSPRALTYATRNQSIFVIDAFTDTLVVLDLNALNFNNLKINKVTRQFQSGDPPRSLTYIEENVLFVAGKESSIVTGYDVDSLRPILDFDNLEGGAVSTLTVLQTKGDEARDYVFGIDASSGRDPLLVVFDVGKPNGSITVNFNDAKVLRGHRGVIRQFQRRPGISEESTAPQWTLIPDDNNSNILVNFTGSNEVSVFYPSWNRFLKAAILFQRPAIELPSPSDKIIPNGSGCFASNDIQDGRVHVVCSSN